MDWTDPHLADKLRLFPLLHGLARATAETLAPAFDRATHPEAVWHLPHPVNVLSGRAAVLDGFWGPLKRAFPDLERRDDIFIAGPFKDTAWIAATGHYVGTFDAPLFGIPATRALAFLRFGELYRIVEGRIAGCHAFIDLVDLARQAGIALLPRSAGADCTVPGPATRDGVLLTPQDPLASQASAAAVEAMIQGLRRYDGASLASMAMDRHWSADFNWYGPCGIGSTRGLRGFEDYHQRPFLRAFPDRRGGHLHVARIADGPYVASLGWPSVVGTHQGEYLGCPATGRRIGMRVMDFWRRSGDLLAENWVFIDLPDLFLQFGVDLFATLPRSGRENGPGAASPGSI